MLSDKRTVGALAFVALGFAAILWLIFPGKAAAEGVGSPSSIAGPISSLGSGPWTGCYVSGAIGYGVTRSEFQSQVDFNSTSESGLSADNVLFSPGIGCTVKVANMVFGVDADASFSNKSTLESDWQWFVGARGGFLVTDRTLLYALIGYTQLDGGLNFDSFAETTRFGDLRGATYGGGIESMFASNWSVKLEYRYVDFGRETAPMGVIDGLVDGSKIDSGAHQVRLGLAYRFGGK